MESSLVADLRALLTHSSTDGEKIEDADAIKTLLSSIRFDAMDTEEAQQKLGELGAIECVVEVFEAVCGVNTHTGLLLPARHEIAHGCVLALVHLCRRAVLNKSTSSVANLTYLGSGDILKRVIALSAPFLAGSTDVALAFSSLAMVAASDSEERQTALSEHGATQAVIDILQVAEHRADHVVVEMTCRAIRNLSSHSGVAEKLAAEGVCDVLGQVLHEELCSRDAAVLESVIWAVVNLSHDTDIAAMLGGAGCCTHLVRVCRDNGFLDDINVSNALCWALRNLTCAALNFGSLVAQNTCELLADNLRNPLWASDGDLMQSAMWAISNMCGSASLVHRFMNRDAGEAIVTVCSHHMAMADNDLQAGPVAEAAVFALRNLILASRFPVAAPEATATTSTAADADTTESIRSEVQAKALLSSALPAVADNVVDTTAVAAEDGKEVDVGIALGAAGACECVLAVLRRYKDREGMVEACCGALKALGSSQSDSCFYDSSGEVNKEAVQSIRKKRDQDTAGVAADNYSVNKNKLFCRAQSTTGDNNAIACIMAALDIHKEVLETVEVGLKALLVVLRDHPNPSHVIEYAQCVDLRSMLVEHARRHKTDYEVVKVVCALLFETFFTSELDRARLVSEKQVDSITGLVTPRGRYADIAIAWQIENSDYVTTLTPHSTKADEGDEEGEGEKGGVSVVRVPGAAAAAAAADDLNV